MFDNLNISIFRVLIFKELLVNFSKKKYTGELHHFIISLFIYLFI